MGGSPSSWGESHKALYICELIAGLCKSEIVYIFIQSTCVLYIFSRVMQKWIYSFSYTLRSSTEVHFLKMVKVPATCSMNLSKNYLAHANGELRNASGSCKKLMPSWTVLIQDILFNHCPFCSQGCNYLISYIVFFFIFSHITTVQIFRFQLIFSLIWCI